MAPIIEYPRGSMGLPATPFRVSLGNSKTTQQMCRSILIGTYTLPPLQLSCVFTSVRHCHFQLYKFRFFRSVICVWSLWQHFFFQRPFLAQVIVLHASITQVVGSPANCKCALVILRLYQYLQQHPFVSIIRIFRQQNMQHSQTQYHYRICLGGFK